MGVPVKSDFQILSTKHRAAARDPRVPGGTARVRRVAHVIVYTFVWVAPPGATGWWRGRVRQVGVATDLVRCICLVFRRRILYTDKRMGFAEFDRAICLSDLGPNFRGFQGPRIIHTLRMVWVVECCRIITVTAPNTVLV